MCQRYTLEKSIWIKFILFWFIYFVLICNGKNPPLPNLKVDIPPSGEFIPFLEKPESDAKKITQIKNGEFIYSNEAEKVPHLSKLNRENYIYASYKEFQGWVNVDELEYIYKPCPERIENIDLKTIQKGFVYSTERNTYIDSLKIEGGQFGFIAFNNRFHFDNTNKGLFVELKLGICEDNRLVFKFIGHYPKVSFLNYEKRCPEGYTGDVDKYIDKEGRFVLKNVKYFDPEKEDFINIQPTEPIICYDECYISCQ
ncbi:MAG TPA: hypothetical protein PK079_11285 [Leptospiraceae bacterium]|nr:hypothetical protein [Leptospiraceae bacterium]HMW08240.1 hypothetical protein [Leptospiraceae bacterium]HMX33978.1 hypothetical protein [Leptospiraceae bacterium]HMY29659.1 hypothetical protein [Leptospiraceae bacterium]HMZ66156.1 hypothetical protein [Leptospiraceae bacterium]